LNIWPPDDGVSTDRDPRSGPDVRDFHALTGFGRDRRGALIDERRFDTTYDLPESVMVTPVWMAAPSISSCHSAITER
jgi:hypothetical protein